MIEKGSDIVVLSLGCHLYDAIASSIFEKETGSKITICDMRFAKPIDTNLIDDLLKTHNKNYNS